MTKDRAIRFVVGGILALFLLVARFMAGSDFFYVLDDFFGVIKEVLPIFGLPAFIVGGLVFLLLPSIGYVIYGIATGIITAIIGVLYVIFSEFRDYGSIDFEFGNPFYYLWFVPKYFVFGFVLYVISLFIYRKFIQKRSPVMDTVSNSVQDARREPSPHDDLQGFKPNVYLFFGKDNLIKFLSGGVFALFLYFLVSLNLVGSTDSFLQTMWYAFSWNVLSILGLSFFGAGGVIFYLLPNLKKAFYCIIGGFIVSILNFVYFIWDEYSNYGYFEFDNYQYLISSFANSFVVGFGICFFAILSKNLMNKKTENQLSNEAVQNGASLTIEQQSVQSIPDIEADKSSLPLNESLRSFKVPYFSFFFTTLFFGLLWFVKVFIFSDFSTKEYNPLLAVSLVVPVIFLLLSLSHISFPKRFLLSFLVPFLVGWFIAFIYFDKNDDSLYALLVITSGVGPCVFYIILHHIYELLWYKKTYASLLFIAIVFLPIFFYVKQGFVQSALIYFSNNTQKQTTVQSVKNDAPVGWKKYLNEEFGFEINYPFDFYVKEDLDKTVFTINPEIYYFRTDLPRDIHLTVYSPSKTCTYLQRESISVGSLVAKNNVLFSKNEFVDVGVGQLYRGLYYTTMKDGECYVIELFTHSTNGAGLLTDNLDEIKRLDSLHAEDMEKFSCL